MLVLPLIVVVTAAHKPSPAVPSARAIRPVSPVVVVIVPIAMMVIPVVIVVVLISLIWLIWFLRRRRRIMLLGFRRRDVRNLLRRCRRGRLQRHDAFLPVLLE